MSNKVNEGGGLGGRGVGGEDDPVFPNDHSGATWKMELIWFMSQGENQMKRA